MAKKSAPKQHREAVNGVSGAHGYAIRLPVVGRVRVPPPEHLAYYATLGLLTALELIEWPIALVIAAGHVLIENRHDEAARELGEALEDA